MMRVRGKGRRRLEGLLYALVLTAPYVTAQTVPSNGTGGAVPTTAATPMRIDFSEALRRAQANEATYAALGAESRAATLDKSIARAGLLPGVVYHNQYLYTQSNGQPGLSGSAPRFITNNAVHEYMSQAVVNETIGLAGFAAVKQADAAAARAAAELEVGRRGLFAATVDLFYGATAARRKRTIAHEALDEATSFTELTRKRENAREAAHADLVKAQLQQQQRQREVVDADLLAARAQLELGVLLFTDPRTPYELIESDFPEHLPSRADVDALAGKNNPEIRSALAAVRQGDADVTAAKAAYLPDLSLNYTYGIDAPQFATKGVGSVQNLGYSASATLDIPVWDWLSTQHRVKQSQIRRDAVRLALSATQRRLIAQVEESYAEAVAAQGQLTSLDASALTASESLRLTKLRYTSGEATVLEVVDAQNAFRQAETQREDGRVRYRAALAGLQSLTGDF